MKPPIILVLAPLALLVPAAGRPDDARALVGTVGPGFTIDVTDTAGNHVSEVPAGHHTFVVRDLSDERNFVFANKPDGPRVRIETTVPFVGDKTFEVDLAPGRYAYACSHFEVMNGLLAAVAPAPPVTTPAPQAKPKR